jgi:hypothetical protein
MQAGRADPDAMTDNFNLIDRQLGDIGCRCSRASFRCAEGRSCRIVRLTSTAFVFHTPKGSRLRSRGPVAVHRSGVEGTFDMASWRDWARRSLENGG